MTRIITVSETKPLILESRSGKPVWVCRCGLSEQLPYCDSSHIATAGEKEDVLYEYGRDRPGAWPTRRACRIIAEPGPKSAAESTPTDPMPLSHEAMP